MRSSSAAAWAYKWRSSSKRPNTPSPMDRSLLAVANTEPITFDDLLALRLVEPRAHLLEERDGLGARDLGEVFPATGIGHPALGLLGGRVERGPGDELPDEPL